MAAMAVPLPDPQLIRHFFASTDYAEDCKWLIHHHLLSLVSAFPSLAVKTASRPRPGSAPASLLLLVDGTIPVPFHGVFYNIPVVIWLLESYPRHPPCVYVNPTRDMIIKRPHPHVSPSGIVSVRFLRNWVYPNSDLVELVREIVAVFSVDPPLHSLRRPPAEPPPPPVGYVGLTRHPPPWSVDGHPPYPEQRWDDGAEDFRRCCVNKIMEKVSGDLVEMMKERVVESEALLCTQEVLRRRREDTKKVLKEINHGKDVLEQELQVVLMNIDVLESWLNENEGKKKDITIDSEPESVFECSDLLSEQLLECTSADLAIEDVMFSLDKTMQEGIVPFDQYLKNVRLLSREQFLHRAMASKIRERQLQIQVNTMAAKLHL